MKLRFLVLAISISVALQAQQPETGWFTDLTAAQAFAKNNNTAILIVFAGSDWCRPCIKFKKDILLAETFSTFAHEKLAILYLDFPARRKNKLPKAQQKRNEQLAEQYNPTGLFPQILLLDAQLNILSQPKFSEQLPEVFIAELDQVLQNPKAQTNE